MHASRTLTPERNDPNVKPGDPYPFQNEQNPYKKLLDKWTNVRDEGRGVAPPWQAAALDERRARTALPRRARRPSRRRTRRAGSYR